MREVAGQGALLVLGLVPAQGHDIADAGRFDALQVVEHLGPGMGDAGEMADGLDADLPLHAADHLDGALPPRAAGAVGQGHEGGVEGLEGPDVGEEGVRILRSLGQEELEGEDRLPPGEEDRDVHAAILANEDEPGRQEPVLIWDSASLMSLWYSSTNPGSVLTRLALLNSVAALRNCLRLE